MTKAMQLSFWILSLIILVILYLVEMCPTRATYAVVGHCTDDQSCFNGGQCNLDTGVCECIQGYKNDLSRGITNCSLIECANGGIGPDENNHCICAEGWGGASCLECLNDKPCQVMYNSTNTTGVCDKTLITYNEKFFQCDIMSPMMYPLIGNMTMLRCGGMNATQLRNGTCLMQVFDNYPNGLYTETLFCTFFNCDIRVAPGNQIEYHCSRSACNCSEYAVKCHNPFVAYVVQNMKGSAAVMCKGNRCVITQENFPGEINANCGGSECLANYIPPPVPPPENYTLVYVTIGVGGIIFTILGIILITSIIVSCFQDHSLKKEYHLMKGVAHGAKIEVRNLNYSMKIMENGKRIRKKFLVDINHTILPGSVTAIMGPSGAGKTTLLDILANRTKVGTITGEIYVNGKPVDETYRRICGYVFQDDNLMSTMTVRECIMFSANLRLPDAMGKAEKESRVDQVMKDLGIYHLKDRKIGDHMHRGISGGEKRRVSIGMELVTSPHILYLDEPTSGLDSASAFSVMKCIVDLSKQGRTIVFSIHQPRSNIFAQFDELILMRSGRIAYAGRAEDAVPYFAQLGHKCPPNFNPADFLIDVLTQSQANQLFNFKPVNEPSVIRSPINFEKSERTTDYDTLEKDNESETTILYQNDGLQLKNDGIGQVYQGKVIRYATSFYSQLLTLSSRAFKNFYRNFYLMPAHFLSALAMGILLGLIYYQLGNNIAACQNRMGSIFFMCCILAFGAMSSLELFITERSIFVRERANGYYYPSAYFISKTLFDIIPLRIFPPIIMGATAYYLIGLRHTSVSHFFWFILIIILFNVVSGALCIAIGAIAPSVASANVMATLFILASALYGGFLLNKDSIPAYLSWVKYLSYWNYAFEALLINELYGFKIIIDPKDMPPYPGDGNFFLKELGMDHTHFYMDIIILSCFAVVYILISGILMKVFVKEKR
jgi:ABC-type multidrug transport system ATPase subunit